MIAGWLNRRRRLAGAVAALLIILVLLVSYQPATIVSHLASVNWVLAGPGLAGLTAIHLLQIETWRHLSEALSKTSLSRGAAITAYFKGLALGSVTPGNIAGDVYRVLAVKNPSSNWRSTILPILGQRASSSASLLSLVGLVGLISVRQWLPSVILVASFFLAIVLLTVAWLSQDAILHLVGLLIQKLKPGGADLSARKLLKAFAPALGLGLAFHLAGAGLVYLLTLSVTEQAPLAQTIGILLVVRIATVLPLTPSGLGLQEGSLVLLLPTVGVSPDAALTISILTRLGMTLPILVGLLCFAVVRLGHRSVAVAATGAPRI